jgi:nucleotide-binding universal stress UspA family protein
MPSNLTRIRPCAKRDTGHEEEQTVTLHQLSTTEFSTVAPNSVLVAVDCSRTSLRAADYAAGLARRNGVGVVGVYVRHHNVFLLTTPNLTAYAHTVENELAGEAEEYLAESAGRLGTQCAFTVVDGSPVQAIRSLAKELQVSALVVGASERWAHRRFGSLAVRLARTAPCPVIIVP